MCAVQVSSEIVSFVVSLPPCHRHSRRSEDDGILWKIQRFFPGHCWKSYASTYGTYVHTAWNNGVTRIQTSPAAFHTIFRTSYSRADIISRIISSKNHIHANAACKEYPHFELQHWLTLLLADFYALSLKFLRAWLKKWERNALDQRLTERSGSLGQLESVGHDLYVLGTAIKGVQEGEAGYDTNEGRIRYYRRGMDTRVWGWERRETVCIWITG